VCTRSYPKYQREQFMCQNALVLPQKKLKECVMCAESVAENDHDMSRLPLEFSNLFQKKLLCGVQKRQQQRHMNILLCFVRPHTILKVCVDKKAEENRERKQPYIPRTLPQKSQKPYACLPGQGIHNFTPIKTQPDLPKRHVYKFIIYKERRNRSSLKRLPNRSTPQKLSFSIPPTPITRPVLHTRRPRQTTSPSFSNRWPIRLIPSIPTPFPTPHPNPLLGIFSFMYMTTSIPHT
jgi:hypothetical protein